MTTPDEATLWADQLERHLNMTQAQRDLVVSAYRAGQSANAERVAALMPFARLLASLPIGDRTTDDVPLYGLDGVYITPGNVRAARAALEGHAS